MGDLLPIRDLSGNLTGEHGYEAKSFDPLDDDLIHDLLGNERLQKPVSALLQTLWEIEAIGASFDGLDRAKAFDRLMVELKAFRSALKEEYEETL